MNGVLSNIGVRVRSDKKITGQGKTHLFWVQPKSRGSDSDGAGWVGQPAVQLCSAGWPMLRSAGVLSVFTFSKDYKTLVN